MSRYLIYASVFLFIGCLYNCKQEKIFQISPSPTCSQPVTISFQGPTAAEQDSINPFTNYNFSVAFSQENKTLKIPGYFAADGNSGATSASEGNIWRVHFLPPTPGTWNFKVEFNESNITANNRSETATSNLDGLLGSFTVDPVDQTAQGFLSKGKIIFNGGRYLKFAQTNESFIKGGAGSPENLLGYVDFDNTYRYLPNENRKGEAHTTENLHRYAPHIKDWNPGDPVWKEDKGKGLIGALNYLSNKGMNSVYFLMMNIEGDGKDVWPYINEKERFRFDCSKLDQWNMVFDHMDRKGLLMHVILQETENETLLDNGDTKAERKIYLREMIARFGHHLGIIWNIGEENGPAHWSPIGQTDTQKKAMLDYIYEIDPYQNPVVIHSHSDRENRYSMFNLLLGHPTCDGMSMQINNRSDAHSETIHWQKQSRESNKPWLVSIDEIGHFSRGVDPDDRIANNQDSVRKEVLWGHYMAGGAGVEWYFGYKEHDNDLNCEDWRSRDQMWNYTNHALNFFNDHLPYDEMQSMDKLVLSKNAWCLGKSNDTYVVYIPSSGSAQLNFSNIKGKYISQWYNPRTGILSDASQEIVGEKTIRISNPPGDSSKDWVALLKRSN